MPSKDLLEKLFDVEHEAEAIIAEAREEAGRLMDSARTQAQRLYAEAHKSALAKSLADRELTEKVVRDDFAAVIQVYRKKLEASRLDLEAFTALCRAALGEKP